MNNSLVTHLQGYVNAMFEDIKFTYTKPSEWNRDKTRLIHELGAHGPCILTIELPALLKIFERSLGDGLYSPCGTYLGSTSRGSRLPKFLGNLYLQIFTTEGKLRDCPSINAIRDVAQVLGSLKNLKEPCTGERTYDAVKDFINIEQNSRCFSHPWDMDDCDFSNIRYRFDDDTVDDHQLELFGSGDSPTPWRRTLQQVCDVLSAQLGDFHSEDPSELPQHGPGVVASRPERNDKYLFSRWSRKLDNHFPYDYYGSYDLCSSQDPRMYPINHEVPSRLIAVPKTLKAPRLIAAEPQEHMWIQQLVRNQLEARIKNSALRRCISFRDQRPNAILAAKGSKDNSIATIDLSSASDRLTCWAIERAFSANSTLLDRLHSSRTRWVRNAIFPNLGEFIKIKKFANQGSACTFPVQTVFYAMVSIASVIYKRKQKPTSRNIEQVASQVRIFGDDIIIPSDAFGILHEMLDYLGLKVNDSKTFVTGRFRESCGSRAFDGYEISPVYINKIPHSYKARTSEIGSYIDTSNNLYLAGLWHSAEYLAKCIPYRNYIPIRHISEDYVGLASYSGRSASHLRIRWNKDLHRVEAMSLSPRSRVKKDKSNGYSGTFQYFIEKPSTLSRWEGGSIVENVSNWRLGWRPLPIGINTSVKTIGLGTQVISTSSKGKRISA